MGRKKGKKSGGQTEQQATAGQPEKESAQKTEVSGEEHAGPYWPQQRKKHVEPASRSGGGDITAVPSQQPEGEINVTAGQSQQPQRERQKQWQSQKQLAHGAGKEGGKKKGQAEHMPGVPPQSLSQAPQARVQRKVPPEGTPPYTAIPHETWWSTPPPSPQPPPPGVRGPWGQPRPPSSQPPPPGVQGPWRQPQRLVGPPGPASESLVAPGATGPSGWTPPVGQAQSSSPAPSEHMPGVPPQTLSQAPQARVQKKVPPEGTPPQYQAIPYEAWLFKPPPPPPPVVQVPRGQPEHLVSPAGPAHGSSMAPGAAGPSGLTRPLSQAKSSSPAPSATSKGVALQIPKRKGCGTKGRRIVVETNYLSLDLSKLRNNIAYHYDVEFLPALPKRLLKRAMEEFRLKHFPNRHPAFDGRKNLYTSQELPEISDTVNVNDDESQKVKEFKVTIKYATQINMESLVTYMKTGSSVVPPQNAVQALDVVLRSARMSHGFVQVGRSFFSPPSGRVVDLGGGLEMWHGSFQSAILGWKPFLNVDVTHKGFPRQQNVVKAIEEICGPPRAGNELDFRQKKDFKDFICGLKVEYMLPNNPSSKRIYRVNNIEECPAKLRFLVENNQSITVQDYFTRIRGVQLRYLHLPCLAVGSLKRKEPIYLPPELCVITGSQVINKKMNEKQTSAMIRSAATSTNVRKNKIMDEVEAVNYDEDPCIQEFGISVGGKFEEVPARILDAPQLQYSNEKCARPEGGKWWPSNFFAGEKLGAWKILTLDGSVKEEALRYFGEQMQKMGRNLGMQIEPSLCPVTMHRARPAQLESFFRSMKESDVRLVVVVVPDKDSYVKVKQIAELTVGVLTQCIKSATMRNLKPATCSNILLKVNSKLNGINHLLADVSKPRCLQSPAMIVGADVTHPPPGQDSKPSVAAVCASNDPLAFKYNIQIRLQPPRVEIIQDMEAIMKKHLLYFYKSAHQQKPQRIIFYRDGVSEGQFLEVLRSEVSAIRRACASLEQGYEPSVTFLVVQKRHHTRFFPISNADADGRNRNVPAGTVVDSKITHPTELDFFLASHASIQGVTRPTKYHLLWNDDDKMTTDEIEQLTYYLCHLFSRCTRSVSYPAPTYNAHLAAYRAGVYLEGSTISLTNLEKEQKKYFESEVLKKIIADSPMYFV